jgi:hypothetical protein
VSQDFVTRFELLRWQWKTALQSISFRIERRTKQII